MIEWKVPCTLCYHNRDGSECDFYKILYAEKHGKGHAYNTWKEEYE